MHLGHILMRTDQPAWPWSWPVWPGRLLLVCYLFVTQFVTCLLLVCYLFVTWLKPALCTSPTFWWGLTNLVDHGLDQFDQYYCQKCWLNCDLNSVNIWTKIWIFPSALALSVPSKLTDYDNDVDQFDQLTQFWPHYNSWQMWALNAKAWSWLWRGCWCWPGRQDFNSLQMKRRKN